MNEFKLNAGDKVAIVAPSAQVGHAAAIAPAVAYLQSLGLDPVFGAHLFAQNRYMAGDDKSRADDVNAAFANSEIRAIFCARAAAGATRILPYVDYDLAAANRKPVIGFCDNAALMVALWQKAKVPALNGFSLMYDFKNGAPDTLVKTQLEQWLSGKNPALESGVCCRAGQAEGRLLPINLSVLLRMAGTPYFPDLRGAVLLVEDVHERLHKIDLMLQQLKQLSDFALLKGIVLGQFTDCSDDAEDGSIEDCLADFVAGVTVPVIKDCNFGHTPSRLILPMGAKVQIEASENSRLKVLGY